MQQGAPHSRIVTFQPPIGHKGGSWKGVRKTRKRWKHKALRADGHGASRCEGQLSALFSVCSCAAAVEMCSEERGCCLEPWRPTAQHPGETGENDHLSSGLGNKTDSIHARDRSGSCQSEGRSSCPACPLPNDERCALFVLFETHPLLLQRHQCFV